MAAPADQPILGTAQYTGQEYFLGRAGSFRSGLLCLGVITGQMLSGCRPHGTQVAQARTPAARRRLRYDPVQDNDRDIPA